MSFDSTMPVNKRIKSLSEGHDHCCIRNEYSSDSFVNNDIEHLIPEKLQKRYDFIKKQPRSLSNSLTSHQSVDQNRTRSFTRSRASTIITSITASIRKLEKTIGSLKGFAVMVGMIIGSGIFISPNLVMAEVKDPGIAIMVWSISGLIALIGSLCYCELGTMIRKAGGNYAYILHIYGPIPAFLCAWTQTLLVDSLAISSVGLCLGIYTLEPFKHVIEVIPWYPKLVACGVLIIAALINCLSTKAATSCQAIFTAVQSSAILCIIVLGTWKVSKGDVSNLKLCFRNLKFDLNMIGNYSAAFFAGLWAFNGWQYIGNIVEDIINVEKNLVVISISSILFVTISYVLVNLSLLSTLTPGQISNSQAPAIDFFNAIFGEKIGYIMPILVAISCYGCINGMFFSCSRVSLATGREGQFPEVLGMIHRSRRTPIPSIFLLALISIIMLLPDSTNIEFLVNVASIYVWVNITVAVSGLIVLRYKQPELKRPFKVWLIAPIVIVIIGVILISTQFIKDPIRSTIAMGILILGLPVYYFTIYLEPKHPNWFMKSCSLINRFIKKIFDLVPCQI